MNQEQNNMNYNNFNTQDSSGISNNLNSNSKPPKKMNIGLIIGVVAVIIVAIIIAILTLSNKDDDGSSNTNTNTNTNTQKNSRIKQIYVGRNEVRALSDDGNLYYIGTDYSEYLDSADKDYKDLKKVASNVEKIYDGYAIYYIDKQQDLYYLGYSYNGGISREIEKDYSGVNDINVYNNFCGFLINKDNELYVKNSHHTIGECGLNEVYGEFTKAADNVKLSFISHDYNGYINNNNELYLSTSKLDYKKIADNVKAVDTALIGKQLTFLTNENKLYFYKFDIDGDINNTELNLLRDDVEELGYKYFKTTNGEYNINCSNVDLPYAKGKTQILINYSYYKTSVYYYYATLDAEDIKEILYHDNERLVYISTNDKVVLFDESDKKIIDNNVNSLKEIYEFVTKSNKF